MTAVPAPWVTDLLDPRVLAVAAAGNLGWADGRLEVALESGEVVYQFVHDSGRFTVTRVERGRPSEEFSTDSVRAIENHVLDVSDFPFPADADGPERDRIRLARLHRYVALSRLAPTAGITEVDDRQRIDWPDGTTALTRARHRAQWVALLGAMTAERFVAETVELDLDELTHGQTLEWEPSSTRNYWWAKVVRAAAPEDGPPGRGSHEPRARRAM